MIDNRDPKDYVFSGDYIMHNETVAELKIKDLDEFINKRFVKLYKNGYLLLMHGYIFGKSRKCIIVNFNINNKKQENLFQTFTKEEIKAFKESL